MAWSNPELSSDLVMQLKTQPDQQLGGHADLQIINVYYILADEVSFQHE